jgi:hypothetical protein
MSMNMSMKRNAVLGLALALCGATAARADEGRTPIYQPAVITQPGSYFLARGLAVDGQDAIVVAASNVTLDLNGQSIQGTAGTQSLIRIVSGSTSVRIRNGRLVGGVFSIYYEHTVSPPIHLHVQNVDFVNMAVMALQIESAGHVDVIACRFRGTGTGGGGVQLQGTKVSGRFTDNLFSDLALGGVKVFGTREILVRDNMFSGVGGEGLFVGAGQAVLVEGNTFVAPPGGLGSWGIRMEADGALIQHNVISGYATGIQLGSRGSRVIENVVRNGVAGGSGAPGIAVYSPAGADLVFRNQVEGNTGCALALGAGTGSVVYRANMLRGNGGGGVCDAGTGNIDGGGNIL